ncbi:MAG TPA: hypothetical protein PK160_02690, partial [Bacillota bacterium]|nr:hypothetical protein [Bacillota bacterium]
MYIRLAKSKYNKEEFVYLVESYRDEKKKPKQRVIKSFGTLSELTKNNPNALEELKGWAKDLSDQQKEERYVSLLLDMNESMTNEQIPLNYGYVFLQALYNELKIPEFIANYQAKTSIKYPLNEILELLVYSRALNPSSKKRTYEQKGNYFFELPDFSLDDVYRSLTHLSSMKDELT